MMTDPKLVKDYYTASGLMRPPTANLPLLHEYNCPTCGDVKQVLVEHPGWVEWVPCPDCTCPVCGDLGVIKHKVPVGHLDFGKLFPCPNPECGAVKAQRQEREQKLIQSTQLDDEYRGLTLDTFMALPSSLREGKYQAYWAAYYFIAGCERGGWVNRANIAAKFGDVAGDSVRNWLVFYGPQGYGKTGFLASIINGVTARGQAVRYARLQEFIDSVQKRYDADRIARINDEYGDSSSSEVRDLVRDCRILAVDEFDVPDIRENKLAIVEDLIRHRYANKLPTVITTNLDPVAFERRWGPTIASVVKARAHWIPVLGERLRETVEEFRWE